MQNILMLFVFIIYLQASNEDDNTVKIFASVANAAETISQSNKESFKPQE